MSTWTTPGGAKPKRPKVTIPYLNEKKAKGEPITFLTAYDYPTAVIEESIGIDIILCGDSLGMTVYGFESTLPVTMEMMEVHSRAVKKGAPTCFVIGDMPYMSYQVSVEQAITNAGRLMQNAGVDGVKLEGGVEMCSRVKGISEAGIPVMGHIGLTPQSISQLGGFKAQGRGVQAALKLIKDAKLLEEAGAFAILLEAIPPELAKIITQRANIPILGIGAGPYCDGQVLVVHDVLGFFGGQVAKFVKQYANLNQVITEALNNYKNEVEQRVFPGPEHCYGMKESELEKLLEEVEKLGE
ncbi:MAG: 3-methyl-2-oxobutanoate hydroxymethyltransferase [Bacillota bacterium]